MSGGTGIIPDKLYFKIGEVKKITGVEPHVLRYWESEFRILRPQRATSKQRLYRRIDVDNILTIKKLLYEDGYTVPGARKYLAGRKGKEKRQVRPAREIAGGEAPAIFAAVKTDLEELKKMLEE